MIRVHPEFVPDLGWRTQGGARSYPSLAALARCMPQATIEGYYPGGYEARREPRAEMGVVRYVGPRTPRRVAAARVGTAAQRTSPLRGAAKTYAVDRNRALDMWARGMTAAQISGATGENRSTVADAVREQRRLGDPRAVVHGMGPRGPNLAKRRVDWDRVLDLWASGATADGIAESLGVESTATVSQIVIASRRRGDPRAVLHSCHAGNRTSPAWDRHRTERLRALAGCGFSATQVALRMNREFPQHKVTRNGVIGKLRRMGLTVHGNQVEPRGLPGDTPTPPAQARAA